MKLQAIKQICSKNKRIVLINTEDGEQWIGDGAGFYPVEGIRLTERNLFTVFDIDAKQAGKYSVREIDSTDPCICTSAPASYEDRLKPIGLDFYLGGDIMRAMMGKDGILFINTAYIKPAARKDEEFVFYLRTAITGQPVVAVYADMLAGAIICPLSVNTMETVRERMEEITKGAGMKWRKNEGAPDTESQTIITEEDTTNV